jgi:hypothetical protein
MLTNRDGPVLKWPLDEDEVAAFEQVFRLGAGGPQMACAQRTGAGCQWLIYRVLRCFYRGRWTPLILVFSPIGRERVAKLTR